MALGSILITTEHLTDSEVCDLFEEHEVIIATLGSRARTRGRHGAIEQKMQARRGEPEFGIGLVTFCVNGAGRICTHDQLDFSDVDVFDELDVFYRSDVETFDDIRSAVEKITTQWRQKGKPKTCHTTFNYVSPAELEDEDNEQQLCRS